MTSNANSGLREINGKIAAAYDRVLYDPPAIPGIDGERVFGLAALYGAEPERAAYDVLDLGCGTGAQLVRAASHNGDGRLVGVDLSQEACAKAAERCAAFGPRAHIMRADVLDLDAAALGQYDLIYHVGVLYITPPEVQRRLLALISACLKPGGVAVISYYYGAQALLLAGLQNTLRLAVDRRAPTAGQVRQARGSLREMENTLARQGGDHRAMLAVLQQAGARSDAILFHELLGEHFGAVSTAALEDALGAAGVHFLNWITPGPQGRPATSRERALMADVLDYAGGGYHYAVFAKSDPSRGPDPRCGALWQSRLVCEGAGSPAVFRDPESGISVNANVVMAAALDLLAAQPRAWDDLAPAVTRKLSVHIPPVADAMKTLVDELLLLWQYGLLTPLWRAR
jgi:2-polyprenyl-3-methyl-5-hydroxy-6-metoxy-1,4-benzoquinol methylase